MMSGAQFYEFMNSHDASSNPCFNLTIISQQAKPWNLISIRITNHNFLPNCDAIVKLILNHQQDFSMALKPIYLQYKYQQKITREIGTLMKRHRSFLGSSAVQCRLDHPRSRKIRCNLTQTVMECCSILLQQNCSTFGHKR